MTAAQRQQRNSCGRTAVSSNYPKFKYTSPRLRERNRPPPASGSSDRVTQAERPPKFKQGQAATIAAAAAAA